MTNEELLDALPGVRIDHDNAEYYRGQLDHRLLVNRCGDCRRWHHPPRPICPACWSGAVAAEEVTGTGTIALLTILRQGPRQPGVDYTDGHLLVAVELDEQPGLRLGGTVLGADPEAVRLGDRVRVVWRDIEGRGPRADFELLS